MKISIMLAAAVICALAACSQRQQSPRPVSRAAAGRQPVRKTAGNGRLIFLTGRDDKGRKIVAASPPLRPSCAACHGASGAGGNKFPDGAISADLRHAALVGKQKPPYTIASIARAVSQGIDNQGKPLDKVMPRWKLSQRDLRDVSQYVYSSLR